jgi:hypothetical protein
MNKKNVLKYRMIMLVTTFVLVLSFVSSANIGVSPANIYFKDVLRGGYAEKIVTITIDSDEPTKISLSTRGNISEWLSFEETEFEVSKNNPYYLKVIVQPPADMPNGNYSGFLRITTSNEGKGAAGQATGIVNAALDLYVEVDITDIEYSSCRAWNFNVQSAEEGEDVVFKVNVYNEGNIRLFPTIKIDVWNQERTGVVKEVEFSDEMVIPTTRIDYKYGFFWVGSWTILGRSNFYRMLCF